MKTYDVIVVGVGSMGIATSYSLCKQGLKVLGIDPFISPHEKGSHTGATRIIRQSYFEHPSYVPLLQRSYELWNELELATNNKIYHETGLLYMGHPQCKVNTGITLASDLYQLGLKNVNQNHFQLPLDWDSWLESKAGYLNVNNSFNAYNSLLSNSSFKFSNEKVLEYTTSNTSIQIKTDKEIYACDILVFTSGAWTGYILAKNQIPLLVTKQTLAWLDIPNEYEYTEDKFPCWFISDPDKGEYYGFPINNELGYGLKLALHMPGTSVHPDKLTNTISTKDKSDIEYFVNKYLPSIKPKNIRYKSCMYTYTPDENFIIDFLPESNNKIIIACGFSGHGFKFAPVVGEIVSNMITNTLSSLDTHFLKLSRFQKN